MIAGVQPKVLLTFEAPNYRLVRERDKLVKEASKVMWIEWNEDGSFKSKHEDIAIGRSLLVFTWQTTVVTEIIEQKDNYIKFKTENSVYELFKIK